MEVIMIDGTRETPSVILDASQGLIEIKGRSVLTKARLFYDPIINWVQEYCMNPASVTEVRIKLEFFNTSSSKSIYDILKRLETINTCHADKSIFVYWYYEYDDDEMLSNCEFYENIVNIEIRKTPICEPNMIRINNN